jgi:hypothetical protein
VKRSCRSWPLLALYLSVVSLVAGAASKEPFADSRPGKEIRRGDDAADDCGGLKAFKTAEYDACITSAEKSRPQDVDVNAFNTGLYFAAWFTLDGMFQPLIPSMTTTTHATGDPKPLAAKYFKLWRDGQKRAGVSDEQMCEATLLDPTIYKQHVAVAEHGY